MKRFVLPIFLIGTIALFFFSKRGTQIKNMSLGYVLPTNYVSEEGMTVSTRILVPEGYQRKKYSEGTFPHYIQNYALKEFAAEVINYDGNPYGYQGGHVGVFDLSVPSHGLMQCADALIRLRAEYLWEQHRKGEIGFEFTSGHYCSWNEYARGLRPKINGNKVTFQKEAPPDDSKTNFYRYLDLVYMYAGTLSLHHELPNVPTLNDLEVGDMLIYPGSPGHVIMIVDKVVNAQGENLFIFAQGNTPSQSVHVLKNLNDRKLNPWYQLEMGAPLEIPTYRFSEVKFVRFK